MVDGARVGERDGASDGVNDGAGVGGDIGDVGDVGEVGNVGNIGDVGEVIGDVNGNVNILTGTSVNLEMLGYMGCWGDGWGMVGGVVG